MPDVPPAVMTKYRRLEAMRALAQAAMSGTNQNANEAQSAWNEAWNTACRQLMQYGQPVFTDEGALYVEQRTMSGPKRADLPEFVVKNLTPQLVRVREDLREARRLVQEAGKRAAPIMRLAHDCERLLAERYQWAANPFATNMFTTYGAAS